MLQNDHRARFACLRVIFAFLAPPVHDQRPILTVSAYTSEVAGISDVSVSLPRLVGGEGVIATFPLQLDDAERAGLTESARVVRQAIESLDL